MRKLLVEMNFRLRNIEEYGKIKKNFINNGYEILNIENFNYRELKIDFLFKFFKENMLKERYDKIILISNIEDMVLGVYRLYNFLADDFIFFIDKYNYRLLKGEIYEIISNLNSVEKENIDEIYMNIKTENICNLEKILKNTQNLKYIKDIRVIKENKKKDKKEKRKVYIYNNEKIDNGINNEKEEKIELNSDENKISIKFLAESLINNTEIAVYYFIMKYKLAENKKEEKLNISKLIKICFEYLEKTGKKEKVYMEIVKILKEEKIEFIWKIQICQILIMVGYKNAELLQISMENLKSNIDDYKYHYGIIIQLFFNSYMDKVEIYKEFNEDISCLLKELSLKVTKDRMAEKIGKMKEIKKIAIIVDQLMDIKHSTAKAAIDYAINIEKYIENSEVALFVEDNFIQNKEETILINQYQSAVSVELKEVHENYLKENKAKNIKIYYSDISKSKAERVKESIDEIILYNPDIILNINNAYSLSMECLSKMFDSYYIYLGLINYQKNQKKNFYNNISIEEFIKKDITNVFLKTKAVNFSQKEKIYKRESLKLKKDDFIMIAVSLIPENDFNDEFIGLAVEILKKYENVKLILAGCSKLNSVDVKNQEILKNQIIFIEYEENLGALYQICDICLNPKRNGGGYSIAEAMFYGLPVLSLKSSRDSMIWLGNENGVENYQEYREKIEKLINEKKYYDEISKLMKEKINSMNYKNYLYEIFEFIEEEREEYK